MRLSPRLHRRMPVATLAVALCLSSLLAACDSDAVPADPATSEADPVPSATPSLPVVPLTYGVWGPSAELDPLQGVVDDYNAGADGSEVTVRTYADRTAFVDELRAGAELPDVFLISRQDLPTLIEGGLNQPVDELLDARGVDVGDGYSRDALEAFAADRRLQCMPYGVSPRVVYYNTDLVDFDRMAERGLEVPDDETPRWSFERFAEAAAFATRPRRGTRGVHIEPTLEGLAPFLYSGGGDLYADELTAEGTPTSLDLSGDDTREALQTTLELLRDATVTLSDEQLAEASPLEWFERGELGMIAGTRALVPELREVDGLDFDVMPMPVLDAAATVGDVTAVCISARSADVAEAADFVVHLTSTESVTQVVRAGFLQPANQQVALSDAFVQPYRAPRHGDVFTDSVRGMVLPPVVDDPAALDAAIAPALGRLFDVAVLDTETFEALTTQIDTASRQVLSPELPEGAPDGSD